MKKKIHVGCSGWYYRGWKNTFYPKNLPEKDFFSYYATVFNTVEVNSSFYHFPSLKAVHNWYNQAPVGFTYSLKVYRAITHFKKTANTPDLIKNFYEFSDILKEKMGCFLFQFPKSFVFNEENLENILSYLNKDHKNVLEFRHPSWWNERVIKAFTLKNGIFCMVSGCPITENIIPTGKNLYIRFHGDPNYRGSYSDSELTAWAEKINSLSFENTWAYFNNTYRGHAASNALKLSNLLKT